MIHIENQNTHPLDNTTSKTVISHGYTVTLTFKEPFNMQKALEDLIESHIHSSIK